MNNFLSASELANRAYSATSMCRMGRLDAMVEYIHRNHYHIISAEIMNAMRQKLGARETA